MRLTILCCFLLLNCALSKTVTKALTESLGQEVIEIGAPLKELPPDLEEEPSMEKDDDETTRAAATPATKKDIVIKKAPVVDGKRKMKDIDRIDGVEQEEDEQRVEKEMADIYKDNDYKADSNELRASAEGDKGDTALRQRGPKSDFVFAPQNINDPKQVEKFRTSPDYIDCKKRKLSELIAMIFIMCRRRYKFQPNLRNQKEIEQFRTSQDDMACNKRAKLINDIRTSTPKTDSASGTYISVALFTACTMGAFFS